MIDNRAGQVVINTIQDLGYKAYYVGGSVRDYLLGIPSNDIDIATNCPVDTIQGIFPKTIPIGKQFGVMVVVIHGENIEVSTFRKDQEYLDGRHPTSVGVGTEIEDANRRDFTINGLFFDPTEGRIIDYVGGEQDLRDGVIRAIGIPNERFEEDKLRMVRAIRYSAKLGFKIHPDTYASIVNHAHLLCHSVSIERIWMEIVKLSHNDFASGIIKLHRCGLLQEIFPELQTTTDETIKCRVKYSNTFPENAPTIAKVLDLFPDGTTHEWEELCKKLKLSKADIKFAKFYRELLDKCITKHTVKKHKWARLYANDLYTICRDITAAHMSIANRKKFLEEHRRRYKSVQWAVKRIRSGEPFVLSQDLQDIGLSGHKIGEMIAKGEEIAINCNIRNSSDLVRRLMAM